MSAHDPRGFRFAVIQDTFSLRFFLTRLTNTLVYYGLSFNTTELAGDPYLNFTLAVIVELIAIGASHYSYEKFGRKIPYAINMSIIGIALLLVLVVPKSKHFDSDSDHA